MNTVKSISTCFFAAGLGLAASSCARAATAPAVFQTSFDCAQAAARIETLICRDAQLARMDIEMMRLYRLALTDEHSVPRPDKVATDQQFWLLARNQCASEPDPKACTVHHYAERAYQLRQGSAIVRTKDPDRLTDGPLAFRCTGQNALISVSFFNADPDVVYVKWANLSITLPRDTTGSGVRYSGTVSGAFYSFGQDGDQALLQKPGSGVLRCHAEPGG